MSYGKLGTVVSTASTYHTVYTVPANCLYAELTINMLNPGTTESSIEVALSATGTPTDSEFIEKGAILPGNGGILQITDIVVSPGELIVIKSSTSGCVVRVSGKEITKI